MLPKNRILLIVLMLALSKINLVAQLSAPALRPQQQQAVSVLKQLYEQAKEFSDEKLRIETQSEIANLLWNYDAPKARAYFTETYTLIDRMEDRDRFLPMFDSPGMMMRREVLWKIASRDSELAERLIQATPKTKEQNANKDNAPDEDKRKLFFDLAIRLISKDAKRATQIIQSNMDGAITLELIRTLNLLQQKEPAVANDLLRQWLLKLNVNAEYPMGDLFILGQYFAQPEKAPVNNDSKDSVNELPAVLIEPLLDFVSKAITLHGEHEQKLSANPPRKRFVMGDMINVGIIASLLPLFEKHRPEQAGIIRAHLGQVENMLPSSIRNGEISSHPKAIDDLLNEAQKVKDEFLRDVLYADAAHHAEMDGNYDRAIEIAGRIRNPDRRPDISLMREMATRDALGKGNISEAYRYAKDLPNAADRAELFSQIALKAFEKSDLQRANELLNVAEKLVAKTAASPEQITALLQIISTKAVMNLGQAFESAKAAIEAINVLYAKPSSRSGFDYFQSIGSFQNNLGVLARHDFQRTLSLAQTIRKKEISVVAQLSVCASVLTDKASDR